MMRFLLAAAVLSAGVAVAQPPAPQGPAVTHAYAGPNGLKVEVETLAGRKGPFPHALRFGDEPASVLNFTDEIALDDKVFLGNPRAALVPGAKQSVAVFQLMPREGIDYSAIMTAACGGLSGIPFVGIENAGRSILTSGFDGKAVVRVYVFEETFAPGRVHLRLCKTIDLTAN
jgi:hypothetical protein